MDGRKTGAGALETAAIPACANDESSVSDTIPRPGQGRLEQGRAMAQVKRVTAWALVSAVIVVLVAISMIGAIWPG
jgi:hypothetical protein